MIYPLLVGVWYTLFSVVYWATGGRDPDGHSWIYPMLDWDHPDTAVITGIIKQAPSGLIYVRINYFPKYFLEINCLGFGLTRFLLFNQTPPKTQALHMQP